MNSVVEEKDVSPVMQPLKKDAVSYDLGCAAVRQYAVTDAPTLRAAINDNVSALIENEFGYQRDGGLESLRIGLLIFNAALAFVAYRFTMPFEEHIPHLILLLVAYYLISLFTVYSSWVLEGKCFLLATPPAGAGRDGKKLRFTSRMDNLYEPKLYVTLDVVSPTAWWRPNKVLLTVERVWNATDLFSKDGFVYPPGIRGHVHKLLADAKWI